MGRQALGKGLAAVLPAATGGDAGVMMIPVEKIVANRDQPRRTFAEEGLRELTASIARYGVLQPVLVRRKGGGVFELVAGERRWRAAKRAGVATVPAMIRQSRDEEVTLLALIENVQRVDLNPVEEGRAYRQLMTGLGLTQAEVAERVGRDRATVANVCRVLGLPPAVLERVASGALSVGHAKVILGASGARAQVALAEQCVKGSWSVRQVEQAVGRTKSGGRRTTGGRRKTTAGKSFKAGMDGVVERLRRRLSTKVEVRPRGRGGEVVVRYYSGEDLVRIVSVMEGDE